MTAWGSVEVVAVAAARDFVQKPWENARLAIVRTWWSWPRARRQQKLSREPIARRTDHAHRRRCRCAGAVLIRASAVGSQRLVTGENGTGEAQARCTPCRGRGSSSPSTRAGLSEGVLRRAVRPREGRVH